MGVELSEVEVRRTGKGRLPAQDPVEFDGVPHRLVNLKRQLRTFEDERLLALLHLGSGQQRGGLLGGGPGGLG